MCSPQIYSVHLRTTSNVRAHYFFLWSSNFSFLLRFFILFSLHPYLKIMLKATTVAFSHCELYWRILSLLITTKTFQRVRSPSGFIFFWHCVWIHNSMSSSFSITIIGQNRYQSSYIA
jgi:hypothetical protein